MALPRVRRMARRQAKRVSLRWLEKTTMSARGCATQVNCPLPPCPFQVLIVLGEYQDYIRGLSNSNPSLRKRDPNNEKNPLTDNNALVVLLDASASASNAPAFTKTEFVCAQDLRKHFVSVATTRPTSPQRRIYIMEGLAKEYISVLGGHFFMDPSFFLRQERTCVWSNDFTPTSDMLPQPSSLDPEQSFHLQYCELRQFTKAIENRYHFCKRTGRHVGMTPPRQKEDSTTGILRRKVSWWCRTLEGGGWDGTYQHLRCYRHMLTNICSGDALRPSTRRTVSTTQRI